MKAKRTDVLIIGSGFGAAPPALRLAKAGLKVVMLEKGPDINPITGFKQTQNPKYFLKYMKSLHGKELSINYIEGAGGCSGFYELLSLRAPSKIFYKKDQNQRPLWVDRLTRGTLDPYYEMGEQMLMVHQIPEREVPKTGQVFSMLMHRLGHTSDRARYAVQNCMQCGRCLTGCIYGAK